MILNIFIVAPWLRGSNSDILQSALFVLPLLPSLGAGEPQSGVNIPVSDEEIFPLVRDLVRTVDTRGVGVIHHSCTGQMTE